MLTCGRYCCSFSLPSPISGGSTLYDELLDLFGVLLLADALLIDQHARQYLVRGPRSGRAAVMWL